MGDTHDEEADYLPGVAHRFADLGDVRLHYVEAGQGPLVVLLHGFPDFWYVWRHQIPTLAAAGFRVAAPDLRGYNRSDRPAGLAAYDLALLARDVARLIRTLGAEPASLVGHDWGGVVAWAVAMRWPTLLDRLAIVNAPHPGDLFARLLAWPQLAHLWYVAFFQLPWLPEALLRADDFASLRRLLRGGVVDPATISDQDVERGVRALARPGALTAALSYYRAFVRRNPWRTRRELGPIRAPLQVIWGDRDQALLPGLAEPDRRLGAEVRVDHLPEAGHWPQLDRPEQVGTLLLRHLRR